MYFFKNVDIMVVVKYEMWKKIVKAYEAPLHSLNVKIISY